jgi:hypothetical protein
MEGGQMVLTFSRMKKETKKKVIGEFRLPCLYRSKEDRWKSRQLAGRIFLRFITKREEKTNNNQNM